MATKCNCFNSIPFRIGNFQYNCVCELHKLLKTYENAFSEPGLRACNTWHQHLGDVKLIWEDGYTMIRPIGCISRGIHRVLEDGSVHRYIDCEFNINEYVARSLDEDENLMFMKWLKILKFGLDRSAYGLSIDAVIEKYNRTV